MKQLDHGLAETLCHYPVQGSKQGPQTGTTESPGDVVLQIPHICCALKWRKCIYIRSGTCLGQTCAKRLYKELLPSHSHLGVAGVSLKIGSWLRVRQVPVSVGGPMGRPECLLGPSVCACLAKVTGGRAVCHWANKDLCGAVCVGVATHRLSEALCFGG
uniref:Uncharacterized protein n=1 Tax=Knipowitschia caucasica TaxID=637954 RepID=A0AAV2JVZ2_KNICA